MTVESQLKSHEELTDALLESEERFRLLVSCVQDYAIFLLNPQGQVSSWNLSAQRIIGYAPDEIIDRHFSVFYSPEDIALDTPQQDLAKARNSPRYETEGWRLRKDGSRFRARIVIIALKDEPGSLRGYAEVTRDISAHQKFEERFRRVVESAPNAMVMINHSGIIEMVNTQAEQMFGYMRAEMLGELVEMLVPERFRGHHPGLRAGFLTAPQSRPMGAGRDLYGRRKDGSEFPIEIGLNPIETDEGPMVLSAIVDISDRKQKEQKIEAALEEKNILLGEIHHRVKNNLQVVHSLLDLQACQIEDENLLNILRDSQNRIHAMALIHQTLYQSKNFARIDFSDVLNTLVPTLIESYGINEEKTKYSVQAIPVLLSINAAIPCGLIVNELVANALKHAFPDGNEGTITISLAQVDDQVELRISDDGVGIPDELNVETAETLGLQLITLLAAQLGAKLSLHRAKPTEFRLTFSASR